MLLSTVARRTHATAMSCERKLKTALIQLHVGKQKDANLKKASAMITEAKHKGAKLIALPECFNSPYGTKFFKEYAEEIPDGPTSKMLSCAAKNQQVYLVGGTIPECDDGKIYNTCTVWDPCGEMIAKFRKIHLFDIDIPGGITFKESEILAGGSEMACFEIKLEGTDQKVKAGLGICYDMRFEEMAKLYRLAGCELLIYPGAFNMTTGPIHWELLQRGRALDNQLYFATVSPARGKEGYIAWGHSQITDPWGKVLTAAGAEEEIVVGDLDFAECDKVRQQIPIFHQRRTDIYDTISKKEIKGNSKGDGSN